MAIAKHTELVLDGSTASFTDRTIVGVQAGILNAAGGSNGASVTTAVSFPEGLPPNYSVFVTPNQNCFIAVTNKLTSGFNVVLTPTLASITLPAGTFDVLVLA